MANNEFYRSWVYLISAVICMSLHGVWHLCNLPCVYALFWLVSIASYVFKSPSICFQGTKYEINCEDVVHVVYLHCRRFYNDMGLVPKFRNSKRCWRKLEKRNTRLKPEMTGYMCFSPLQILRLPRYMYLLTFGFPWTRPSLYSPWYQWHNCSSNMIRIQELFWLGNTSNRKGLLACASHFLFRPPFLWRSAICKWAMKWYPMHMCTRWLCPFNQLLTYNQTSTHVVYQQWQLLQCSYVSGL